MFEQVAVFSDYRALLISIAYRMLGSVMDAEDMVQETFLRWQSADLSQIESPKSYLCTVVTRLCIDHLRGMTAQRETYIGEWLPEPYLTTSDHELGDDTLSMAFLLLLESLSPVERAIFLLREVFDYDYSEISVIVDKTESNCRQMFSRAQQHISAHHHRYRVQPEQHNQFLQQFVSVCAGGDLNELVSMLAADIVERSDGGGKVRSALLPIFGPDKVARFFLGILKQRPEDFAVRTATLNGQTALLSYTGDQLYNVLLLDFDENGSVHRMYIIGNPDKLKLLQRINAP
jgi:RNA polymerase sigma-70 factor, ECF subfamily